jgi:hypothetical protein
METRVKTPSSEELEARAARGDDDVTPEEWYAMYDAAAREWMGISAEEFIARWNAGEYDAVYDTESHPYITELVFMMPGDRNQR